MTSKLLQGSCACGNITYTSTSPTLHLDYCYCLTCQRVSGAPFMAWTGIPSASLTWHFKTAPFIYRPTVGETGYFLYPEKSHVAASTVRRNDFGEMVGVGCHIWCRRVPEWFVLPEDGVERFEEFDGVFGERLERWLKEEKG